jgi:lysophospholipase L1-like esterase
MHDGIHLNANGKKVISEKIANELSTLVLAE